MDFVHINRTETVLQGTTDEFLLLGQALTVLSACEIEAAVLAGDSGPFSRNGNVEIDELMAKLPHQEDSTDSNGRFGMTVTGDELGALGRGLRLAVAHARKTRAVLGVGVEQQTLGRHLSLQIQEYLDLNAALKPAHRSHGT